MKVRILTFAVVLSFLAINASVLDNVLAQKATKKKSGAVIDRWYVFVSPDREFTLSFPTKPRREPNGQGLITIIRSYALNTENGMRFSINMQDIGGNPDARLNNEWDPDQDPLVAAAARQNGERVVQIHRLSKNIVEFELWQTVQQNGANINYLRRNILRRGRVYSLGCGSVIDNRQVDKSICRRFFNSMRFISANRPRSR